MRLGAAMKWHKVAIGGAAMFAAGSIAQTSPASAQTFDSYRCADGTQFILAFYPGDKRAYLQIDGHSVTLKKSLALPGKRYSGGGVNFVMTATGIRLKHARRPATACEL
jgi:membrane-bound inhibitor of C-type lysozyme